MLFEYETNRLLLKILSTDAAPYVLDFYQRDLAIFEQYEPDRPENFYTLPLQKAALRYEYNAAIKGTLFRFYVFCKDQPQKIIGTICFHNIRRAGYSSCEIGYKFSSSHWRQGYATEAMEKVIEIIFKEQKLHRVMAWAVPENTASRRLLNRLHFEEEGLCRNYINLHNEWVDHVQYSLIREVWEQGL